MDYSSICYYIALLFLFNPIQMKNIHALSSIAILLLALIGVQNLQAQTSQTFDASGWGGSYGNYTVGGWSIGNGYRETTYERTGAAAVRLRNSNGAYVESASTGGGVGTITFWYRSWDGSPSLSFYVQTSPDASSWTTIATISSFTSTSYTQFNQIVNDVSASYVRVYVYAAGERLIIDDFDVSEYTGGCAAPTTQASSFGSSNVQTTSATITWNRGNGNNVLVLARQGSAVNDAPTSGTSYSANASFGSGDQIGTGNFVVYNGSGTSVNLTNLTADTDYHFAIYEYNNSGTCYNLTELIGNIITDCVTPDNAGNFAAACGNTATDLSWTNGACFDEVLIVARASSAVSFTPTGNGSSYTANSTFGSGTNVGSNQYVVYKGTGTSININGLSNGTTYYFTAYTRKGTTWSSGVSDNCAPASGPCGTESFSSYPGTGSTYTSGSYTGDNGVSWIYNEGRSVTSTYNITGESLGFSDSGTGYVRANSGSGGVGTVTFSMRSYFTGGGAFDRTIAVYVNGSLKGSYTLAAMNTVYTHNVAANESGNVLIEFRSTGSRQVVIDDIEWTCTSSCTPPADPTGTISGTTPACDNTSLSFSGSVPGGITYYWQSTTGGTSTANNAASSLSVTSSGNYYVRAYNSGTTCWSDGEIGPYSVTINSTPSVSAHPSPQTAYTGDNTSFSVTASSAGSYQWQVNTGSGYTNISNGGIYSGATISTLNITGVTLAMDGYTYRCIVGGVSPCGSTTSNGAVLTVINAVAVTDNGCQNNDYAELTLNYPTNLVITDINVGVKVTSTWRGDLIIKLESPDGTEVTLLNNVGGSADNVDAIFDDAGTANALSSGSHTLDATYDVTAQVEGALTMPLSTFNGELSQGVWKLKVCDDAAADLAYINDFELFITGTTPCTPVASISSFAPATGPEGTMVTITGTGFTGATAVQFNGINATSYSIVNSTTIRAEVPAGSVTGRVRVFDSFGCDTRSASDFTLLDESGVCGNGTTATELFISEIFDATTGDFHFVEIFNGTAAAVNLSSYSVRIISYGNNGSATTDITLSGTLAAGDVYLLTLGNSSNPCGVSADQHNSSGGFNGNDEVMLRKSGSTIDFVENPNQGAGFSQTRNATVTAPSTTYNSSEWVNTSVESCADLGSSPYSAGPSIDITDHPDDVAACSFSMTVTATSSSSLSYQWYYNDGSASGWSVLTTLSGVTVTGATGNTLTLSGNLAAYDDYQFYCELSAGSCSKMSNAAQYTVDSKPVYRALTNGNWDNVSIWEMANTAAGPWVSACDYPQASNSTEVIIPNGYIVTLNLDLDIDKVTIDNGGTLELDPNSELTIYNSTASADLIVNGTLLDRGNSANGINFEDNSGTANDASWLLGASGTIIKTNNSSVNAYRDMYEGGISTIPATANWYYRYNGDGTPITTAVDMYYPNLYFENTASAGNYAWDQFSTILNGQTGYCTVKGDLNLGVTGTGTVTLLNNNFNAQPMLILGDLYIETGSSLSIEADPALSPANVGTTYDDGTGFEVRGSVLADGDLDINHNAAGTLLFSGSSTQYILGSGTLDIWNMEVNATGTVELSRAIVINNNIDLTGGTLDAAGEDITLYGHWINTGATYTHNNNVVILTGSGNTNVQSNGQYFHQIDIDKTGAAIVAPSADDMYVADELKVTQGNLEVPTSRKIEANTFDQTVNGNTLIEHNAEMRVNP